MIGRPKYDFKDYQITEDGKVINPNGKELKPRLTKKGYQRVIINHKDYYIHRLVAEKYIPNPDNKLFIDHINCDVSDNRVENLRWVTSKENMNNPLTKKRISQIMTGYKRTDESIERQKKTVTEKYGVSVIQMDKNNNIITIYKSIAEASSVNNIPSQNISGCIHNKRKTAGGYKWKTN